MAVKLRLMRMGKTKQPTYRVVAADSRSPRDGRFIEILGVYAPRGRSTTNPDAVVEINNDKALKWLRQGALPTDRVERLLRQSGAWDEFRSAKSGDAPAVHAAGVSATSSSAAGASVSAGGAGGTASPASGAESSADGDTGAAGE